MSALLMVDTCDDQVGDACAAVSVTLRSAPTPCEISTLPR